MVVRFCMSPAEEIAAAVAGDRDVVGVSERWFSIGLQYFKPFRPTMMLVDRVADLAEAPFDPWQNIHPLAGPSRRRVQCIGGRAHRGSGIH